MCPVGWGRDGDVSRCIAVYRARGGGRRGGWWGGRGGGIRGGGGLAGGGARAALDDDEGLVVFRLGAGLESADGGADGGDDFAGGATVGLVVERAHDAVDADLIAGGVGRLEDAVADEHERAGRLDAR